MKNTGSIMKTTIDDLSERVSIVYYEPSRSLLGDIVHGEEKERCKAWAKILPLTARTGTDGIERTPAVTYRIVIRYRTGIFPDDMVVWRGKLLEQVAPPYDAESMHVWTVLECREAVADGTAQPLP